jgi:hypothetical protein
LSARRHGGDWYHNPTSSIKLQFHQVAISPFISMNVHQE